jgi:hypothetical protein
MNAPQLRFDLGMSGRSRAARQLKILALRCLEMADQAGRCATRRNSGNGIRSEEDCAEGYVGSNARYWGDCGAREVRRANWLIRRNSGCEMKKAPPLVDGGAEVVQQKNQESGFCTDPTSSSTIKRRSSQHKRSSEREGVIELIRVDGQSRKRIECRFADFVTAYTTEKTLDAKKRAPELAGRLVAHATAAESAA